MIDELAKRLRDRAGKYDAHDYHSDIEREAAARIEQLEAEIGVMLNAPEEQAGGFSAKMVDWLKARARAALGEKA